MCVVWSQCSTNGFTKCSFSFSAQPAAAPLSPYSRIASPTSTSSRQAGDGDGDRCLPWGTDCCVCPYCGVCTSQVTLTRSSIQCLSFQTEWNALEGLYIILGGGGGGGGGGSGFSWLLSQSLLHTILTLAVVTVEFSHFTFFTYS